VKMPGAIYSRKTVLHYLFRQILTGLGENGLRDQFPRGNSKVHIFTPESSRDGLQLHPRGMPARFEQPPGAPVTAQEREMRTKRTILVTCFIALWLAQAACGAGLPFGTATPVPTNTAIPTDPPCPRPPTRRIPPSRPRPRCRHCGFESRRCDRAFNLNILSGRI